MDFWGKQHRDRSQGICDRSQTGVTDLRRDPIGTRDRFQVSLRLETDLATDLSGIAIGLRGDPIDTSMGCNPSRDMQLIL